MGESSLLMTRLKRRSRALAHRAAIATRVIREEDLLVLEHRSAQPAAMNDARLEPGALALAEAGVDAALLAWEVEKARLVALTLGRQLRIDLRELGHARPAPTARSRHTGTDHHTRNGAKEDLVRAIHGAEP